MVLTENNFPIELYPVFYVPKLELNIISVPRILRSYEYGVDFYRLFADIYGRDDRNIVFRAHEIKELMFVRFSLNRSHSSKREKPTENFKLVTTDIYDFGKLSIELRNLLLRRTTLPPTIVNEE